MLLIEYDKDPMHVEQLMRTTLNLIFDISGNETVVGLFFFISICTYYYFLVDNTVTEIYHESSDRM